MDYRFWVVAAVNTLFVVVLGLFGGFILLVGLNGVSESRGGVILLAYAVLLVILSSLAFAAGSWGARAAATATGWSLWLIVPATVIATVLASSVALALGALVIILVAGVR